MTRFDELPEGVRPHTYGAVVKRGQIKHAEPTEAEHQSAVVEFCGYARIPVFHVPNGGSRNAREAANLKRQGVMPGVPDLCIPVARGTYHGLFIEMKRNSKSTITKEQRIWVNRLNEEGYLAIVCCGADEAISQIQDYVGQKKGGH